MKDRHLLPRLYVGAALEQDAQFQLTPEQSHYLANVLRQEEGAKIRLFNGRHGEWLGLLVKVKKKQITVCCQMPLRPQAPEPDIWLCCAPLKKAHFDFMVMKATELGVSRIQPLLTGRTQIRTVNTDRMDLIACEAAEQSERLHRPSIQEPLSLEALLNDWPQERHLLVCAESGEAQPIAEALRGASLQKQAPAAVFVGPEGGFEAAELEALCAKEKAHPLRLGPRILRADTAALAAISCWQALCGDWNLKETYR